jgi:hypothetical protein
MVSSAKIKKVLLASMLLAILTLVASATEEDTPAESTLKPNEKGHTHFGPTLLQQEYSIEGVTMVPLERMMDDVYISWHWKLDLDLTGELVSLSGGKAGNRGTQVSVRQEKFKGRTALAIYVTKHGREDIFYARLGRSAGDAVYRFPLKDPWNYMAVGLVNGPRGKQLEVWTRENQKEPAFRALVSPLRKDGGNGAYLHGLTLKPSIKSMSEINVMDVYRIPLPKITSLNEYL